MKARQLVWAAVIIVAALVIFSLILQLLFSWKFWVVVGVVTLILYVLKKHKKNNKGKGK